jgi:hypothetical protein
MYYQDDTQEGPVIADTQTGKFNVYLCLARRHVLNNSRSRDRGLYSPKRCALDRLWKIERTAAGQACSADWPVLPPAGKQALRIAQQRFRARRLEQRLLVIARLPSLRHLLVASFPVTVLIWTSPSSVLFVLCST